MKKRLLILSIDALFYDDMEYMKTLPNFKAYLSRASYTKGMQTIYPSLTYPAHASIATGQHPSVHGIYQNEKLDLSKKKFDWNWYHKDLKVDTILDVAKKNGYSTSSVLWPVMGACPNVDYLIAEIWAETPETDPRPVFEKSSSKILMDTIFDKYKHHLNWMRQPNLDEFGVCCAEEIIETYQPEVMMIHLAHLDHTRHANGLQNEAVKSALRDNDLWFGRLMAALKKAGVYESTNIVILGDHGHMEVDQVVCPNVIFAEHGLIDCDENGRVNDYDAYCFSAAFSTQVILKDPKNCELRKKVLNLLEEMKADESLGIEQIITKEDALNIHNVKGNFEFILEGDGTSFHNDCVGEIIRKHDNSDYKLSLTTHGHLPYKGPQPAFIAAGPMIIPGIEMKAGSVLDEAPTFAEILEIEFEGLEGEALKEIIKKGE